MPQTFINRTGRWLTAHKGAVTYTRYAGDHSISEHLTVDIAEGLGMALLAIAADAREQAAKLAQVETMAPAAPSVAA